MAIWTREKNTAYIMDPSQQVVLRKPKGIPCPPLAICSEGFNHLWRRLRVGSCYFLPQPVYSTIREGSGSLCFKDYKAQTFGHLAPGCEDALSGLDPANRLPPLDGGAGNHVSSYRRIPVSKRQTRIFKKKYRKKYKEKYESKYDSRTYWKKYRVRAAFEPLCEGKTTKGKPCQNLREPGGRFCSSHKGE